MMFVVRSGGKRPETPGIAVKLSRDAPPVVSDRGLEQGAEASGKSDRR